MPSEGLPTEPHNQSKTRLSQQHLELELGLELGLDQVLGSVVVVRGCNQSLDLADMYLEMTGLQ